MRVALVHDWLTGMRGGEKVLEVLANLFPAADIFTLVHLRGQVSPAIEKHKIITSPLQKIPGIDRYYRHLLPVMPWAIEQLDFSGYDLLISTSHCVAKGAMPAPSARHWCYCHTPMRYIWDQFDAYFGPGSPFLTRLAMTAVRPYLQGWDLKTTPRVHQFIANSENVRARIRRIYKREAKVIYPPVDVSFYSQPPLDRAEDFYLMVSAFAPYKRIDLAVKAFNRLRKPLVIIGEGQENQRLRAMAGPNIRFLGWLQAEQLRSYYARARALIFPGEEDFGIVPVEAMAAGCPVIAFRKGGALETVDQEGGLFFEQQTPEDLIAAITQLDTHPPDRSDVRKHAIRFSREHCESAFRSTFIEYQNEMS